MTLERKCVEGGNEMPSLILHYVKAAHNVFKFVIKAY